MAVFATVATHESRTLEDVLAEALAFTAARWERTRHTLHIDPRDRVRLDEYLDSLEADPERMEEEAEYRAATTPAMRAAALASDEREAFVLPDLEEWDRSLPFGDFECALAIED